MELYGRLRRTFQTRPKPPLPIIYNNVCEKRNMGARPIAREIQIQLEDKLTDFIINNDVKKGYTFTENDLLEM